MPDDYFRKIRWADLFPDRPDAPLEIDLGCGDGSFLLEMAQQFPERNFLGIERLLGRVRKVCRKADRGGLVNVRLLRIESSYALGWLFPEASVTRLHLLCPDPWPKKRHHRRRLVKDAFVRDAFRLLEPGGEFLFKTDHREYFDEAVEVVRGADIFAEDAWPEDAFFYPQTDFERQWLGEGKTIQRARFVKR